ncbi:MAG: hypothetical protein ACJA1B_000009 [Polaribacter sp.]|jgi:hypothetical protein
MKAQRLLLVIGFLFFLLSVKSQNAEQYINNVVNDINYKIAEVHQLASQKQMYECIAKLDEVYFKISSEIRKGTFDEEYKNAKRNNPNFTYKIRKDLPNQLEATYWKSKLAQCERILANQDVVIEGMIAAKKLNNDDKFLALLKQLKTGYDAISGIIENTATFNPLKLGYDLHGNFNDAINNYKEYENAELANLEIDEKLAKFNLTIAKAEKNKNNFHFFKKYLKDNYDAVTSFKANVEYLNKIKNSIDSGPIDKLDISLKYNWNYGPFQKEVKELCKNFNIDDDYCSDFKLKYDKINRSAKRSLNTIIENIKASDDQANKQRFLNENNARWPEYKGVVDPIFQKVYTAQCDKPITQETSENDTSNNEQSNKGNENTEITVNDRVLNIQSLELETTYGVSTNSFYPSQKAKVSFSTKWDGKFMERVQIKILLDNEVVLDEILAFRNSMGDFLSNFSKTIQIPEYFGNGDYRLSLHISRDPKVLNKSIQVKCTPKTILFNVTDTRSLTINEGNEINKEEEEGEEEVKKTTKPITKISGSTDKYWENEIPDNAHKEWAIIKDGSSYTYEVKYSVNGRTVGYRAFSDPEFKNPKWESIRNNLAIKHGAQRKFSFDKEGNYFVSEIEFYRANKRMANRLTLDSKGEIKYGEKLDYINEKLMTHIPSEPQLSLANIAITGNVDYTSINLPSNPIKLISGYSERYYAPNVLKQHMGTYTFSGGEFKLRSASLRSGRKVVAWSFYTNGNLLSISTYLLSDRYKFYQEYYTQDKVRVGTRISRDGTQIYLYGKKVDKQTYLTAKAEDNWLPSLADGDAISSRPFNPQNYPDPAWATSNPLNLFIEDGSQLWRVEMTDYSTNCFYVNNHNISGLISWNEKKQSLLEVYRDMHQIYRIRWKKEGQLSGAHIRGHIYNEGLRISVKDGEIQSNYENTSLPYYSYSKTYAKIKNTPSLEVFDSPRLTDIIEQPKFPPAEITPLFKKIWNGLEIDYSAPTSESISEQSQLDTTQTEKPEIEQSDQAAIDAELSKLMDEIRKIKGQADISFNKKYWNDPNSMRVTMNESNPKQEAMDILRRAIPIVDRAKYPGPKLMAYHMLAMHFTDYSGRVNGNLGKQAFFIEAAKQINKADQLMPQLRSMGNQALSNFYVASAEVWRAMTRKAQWGNHAYNKMACDKKVMQQYERAVQTDPNNTQARRMLEKLRAPKKAVPAAATELDKIRPEAWNDAEAIRHKLKAEVYENVIVEQENELNKKVEINALELADLTVEHTSGTVYIKRSGAEYWEEIQGSVAVIFNGDAIKTSEDAKGVSVTFQEDHTFFAIKNNAEVLFIDDHKFVIKRGEIRVEVTKKGKEFLVITPFHTVGVRGTEFEVNVKSDQTTETYVYEGVVETRNGTDIAYLEVGDKVIVKKGDDNISESTFNVAQRNQSEWSGIEQQKIDHQRSVESTNINVEPKRTDKRTNASRIYDRNIQKVNISASPDKKYHEVLVSNSLDYQHIAIVARCPVNVSEKTAITVNWYFNNLPQPISVGNYEVLPQASEYDATIFSYDRPLNPGVYKVEFIMNGNVIGRSEVSIKPQEDYDEQEAKKYYIEAVKGLDMALQFLNGGDYTNAGEMARSSLPILQSVLYNAPNLPDVLAVLQAAQTVNSLDKVNNLLQQNNSVEALKWAKVSLATVSNAHQNCKDDQFKQTLTNLKNVVEEIVFELNKL